MMVKLRHLNSVGDIKCIGEAALVLEMQFLDLFFLYTFLISAAVSLAKLSLYCHNCYETDNFIYKIYLQVYYKQLHAD